MTDTSKPHVMHAGDISAQEARYLFTVFTPTYNRAGTLQRVYDSLCRQTFRDFEWLIVDDGSTDGTASLVKSWQAAASFPIAYIVFEQNRGINAALNAGVQEARGKFFLPMGSDDECLPHALERFEYHWHSIPDKEKARFSGVTALCVDQHGQIEGNRFPYDPTDSNTAEIRYRYRVTGEKWGFQRTDVLQRFPFPTDVRGTVPEGIVWTAIGRHFKTRYVNEPLRVYWHDEPGREDSLSKHAPFKRSAPGFLVYHRSALNRDLRWFRFAPLHFWSHSWRYSRTSFYLNRPLVQQFGELETMPARALWAVGLSMGYAVYLVDRLGLTRDVTDLRTRTREWLARRVPRRESS
jgi:glycosyltransferase involved in cell wall biosynthesis